MTSLADRIEALEGPCRVIDAEICIALGISQGNVLVGVDGWCINSETNPNPYRSPAYTASIDDAMTLVPDGFGHGYATIPEQDIIRKRHHRAQAFVDGNCSKFTKYWRAEAATPALALCAAALRAKENPNE